MLEVHGVDTLGPGSMLVQVGGPSAGTGVAVPLRRQETGEQDQRRAGGVEGGKDRGQRLTHPVDAAPNWAPRTSNVQTIKMLWRAIGMDIAVLEPREVLRWGLATMLGRLGVVSSLECHRSIGELRVARKARGNEWKPDIVIVSCARTEDVADIVRSMFPSGRVLELVASAEPRDLAVAAKSHADGYLMLDDITEATLVRALQALMRGELPMPLPVANYLFERARSTDALPSGIQPYFSPSERDVIALLLEGLSNGQIAKKLGISLHSAKRRVSAVLHKTNSPSRAHFVAQMLRDD